MVLISIFKRFISMIVFPGDPDIASKRALASLIRGIAKSGPQWYEPWSDRLTSNLANVMDRISARTSRADAIFTHTILADDKERERIEDALIDAALKGEGRALADLGFPSIRMAADGGNTPDPLVEMDAIFRERLGAMNSLSVAEVVSGHASMLRLASFCAYRFSDISTRFTSSRKGGRPLSKIPAADLLPTLEDLYFLIAGCQFGKEMRTMYLSLVELSGQTDYPPEQAAMDLQTILEAITGSLKDTFLLNVIRAIRSDPYFEPAVDTVGRDLKKNLINRLSSEYGRRRAALAEGIRAEAINAMLKKLFGGVELLPVAGWTEAESATLMSAGMPGLTNLTSISALKNFLRFLYADRIRPAISNAIVELDFSDTDFRRSLSDSADAVDRLQTAVGEFEASVIIPGQNNYARYITAMRDGSLDTPGHRSAIRAVESVKIQADAVIQSAFSELGALSVHLLAMQDDLRSRDPRILYKVQTINQRKRGIVDSLAEATKETVSFLGLLRMLSVDRERAKQAVNRMVAERPPVEP
ncbi:MAG: hypothetical protein A3J97_16145 [Spirochaetes bacterium RIFOXYC1_FULL_54_7]|nr:MAG: hypothetical protein A3J97_16145 [Spirochaetes bacterium RIFOXYC1_FULL_54_7]